MSYNPFFYQTEEESLMNIKKYENGKITREIHTLIIETDSTPVAMPIDKSVIELLKSVANTKKLPDLSTVYVLNGFEMRVATATREEDFVPKEERVSVADILHMPSLNDIRRIKNELGLKQRDIAKETGMSQATISRLMLGEKVGHHYWEEVCKVLKLHASKKG